MGMVPVTPIVCEFGCTSVRAVGGGDGPSG